MSYFTSEELHPTEQTLALIRQIAYTYRSVKSNGQNIAYCLN